MQNDTVNTKPTSEIMWSTTKPLLLDYVGNHKLNNALYKWLILMWIQFLCLYGYRYENEFKAFDLDRCNVNKHSPI